MGFLDYSNQTQSNIIPKEEFDELLQEVFSVIADNMAKSLGPLGSSATILDGMMTEATKDGYSIMKKYRFHNRYKKMIYNLIYAPCTKMNNTVGDATTTAIVLTNSLYRRYVDRSDVINTLYRLPRQFTQVWDDVIDDITKRVQGMATQIDPDDRDTIYNIAYVTSNGNKEVSNAIADAYAEAKYPGIKKKDSPTNKSYIQPIDGFDFDANLISDAYVRNEDMSATENDIAIMIFDHKVETDIFNTVIKPINEVMRAKGKKLLILAPFFDALMCETELNHYLITERNKYGGFNLILAQFSIGKLPPHQLQDLATVLRAKIFNQNLESLVVEKLNDSVIDCIIEDIEEDETSPFYRIIGCAKQAILSCMSGSVFKVENIEEDEEYQRALLVAERDLKEVMDNTDYERHAYAAKIYDAKARLMQLRMKNYIYYVGADSALQKQILEDSIDDVIKCLRSATKNGVVPGCQISIMRACTDVLSEIEHSYTGDPDNNIQLRVQILGMIRNACTDVYNRVLHGPNGDGIVKTIPGWQYVRTEEESTELTSSAIDKGNSIIKESVKRNEVFDMETLEFNPGIITSAETDTMVLSAASELVKILISGNQCIVIDSDVDESHEEKRELYV